MASGGRADGTGGGSQPSPVLTHDCLTPEAGRPLTTGPQELVSDSFCSSQSSSGDLALRLGLTLREAEVQRKLSLGPDASVDRLRGHRSFKNGDQTLMRLPARRSKSYESTTCRAFHPASEPIHGTIRGQQAWPRYVGVTRRCDRTATCPGKRGIRRVATEGDHGRAI